MKPRRTRQLAAVESVLHAARDHPTAAQVRERVACLLPQVSLGTVYRNLEKLIHSGGAVAVRLQGEVTRYDGMVEAHDHFVCQRCGSIIDLVDRLGPTVDTSALALSGYAVRAHALALFGNCPACA